MYSVNFAKQFFPNFFFYLRGGGSCMCRPEPIKVLLGQAFPVSTEIFKVGIQLAGCWQNLFAFLLPVEMIFSKGCFYQQKFSFYLQVTCMFSLCGLSLAFCATIRTNLSFLFFSTDQHPACESLGVTRGKTLIYIFIGIDPPRRVLCSYVGTCYNPLDQYKLMQCIPTWVCCLKQHFFFFFHKTYYTCWEIFSFLPNRNIKKLPANRTSWKSRCTSQIALNILHWQVSLFCYNIISKDQIKRRRLKNKKN